MNYFLNSALMEANDMKTEGYWVMSDSGSVASVLVFIHFLLEQLFLENSICPHLPKLCPPLQLRHCLAAQVV